MEAQQTYQREYRQTSTGQTHSPEVYLKRKPLIKAEQTPQYIIGTKVDIVKATLIAYQKVKSRMGWDEFAQKLDDSTRDTLRDVFQECLRNGYLGPYVWDGSLYFRYLVEGPVPEREPLTLCSLCERDCTRKNKAGVFQKGMDGNEVKKCWQ